MKTTTTIVLLIVSSLLFQNCKKCRQCTTSVKTVTDVNGNVPGYPQTSNGSSSFEACGDDLKRVDGKTTTTKSTAGSGNYTATVTITSKTTCK